MQVFYKTGRQEVFVIKYTLIYYKGVWEKQTRLGLKYKVPRKCVSYSSRSITTWLGSKYKATCMV